MSTGKLSVEYINQIGYTNLLMNKYMVLGGNQVWQ